MDLLGLEETFGRLLKRNGVQWFGHVLRKDDNVSKRELTFEVVWRKERG